MPGKFAFLAALSVLVLLATALEAHHHLKILIMRARNDYYRKRLTYKKVALISMLVVIHLAPVGYYFLHAMQVTA